MLWLRKSGHAWINQTIRNRVVWKMSWQILMFSVSTLVSTCAHCSSEIIAHQWASTDVTALHAHCGSRQSSRFFNLQLQGTHLIRFTKTACRRTPDERIPDESRWGPRRTPTSASRRTQKVTTNSRQTLMRLLAPSPCCWPRRAFCPTPPAEKPKWRLAGLARNQRALFWELVNS